ncbi:MAG TPA: hypothetical protein VNT29_06770 [Candidatus Limnocylindrales bacterium]|nr:hypothetical protein [Candidatus Limnocylindrales bacterium]
MKPALYLMLCLAADVVVAYGDFLSKRWAQGQGLRFFFAAYGLYVLAVAAWFALIKINGDVGRSAVIWCTGGIVASLLIGAVCFGETLSLANKIGIGFGLVGVVLTAVK